MIESREHASLEYVLARIIQDFVHFMHETGLSGPQIHALLHIYHAGACPVSEIGELSDASPAAASQLVERLVQQGLVQRTEDPSNRRIKQVRLTEKSLHLIRHGIASNPFLIQLMAVMPERHRRAVHTAFKYLAEASQQVEPSHHRTVIHHA